MVETPAFERAARRIFSDEERAEMIDAIARDPECGDHLGGGLRKVRFASSGRGKRGGARVVFYFGGQDIPVYLLALFAKNERSDLTRDELADLRRLAAVLARTNRARRR